MTPDEIRRAVAVLPIAARRELVDTLDGDLRLDERVTEQAEWLSHRLRAAHIKRGARVG